MTIHVSVFGVFRMESESDQAFFVSFAADLFPDIKKRLDFRFLVVLIKPADNAVLFYDKQPAALIIRACQVNRPVESQCWIGTFESNMIGSFLLNLCSGLIG